MAQPNESGALHPTGGAVAAAPAAPLAPAPTAAAAAAAALEPETVEVSDETLRIKDEYNVWKKNVPYLYDIYLGHALEWPSLTCEWLPRSFDDETETLITRRLLLGTHTSGGAQNHLMVTGITLPQEGTDWMHIKEDGDNGGSDGSESAAARTRVKIEKRFPHDGEVNRARHCWGNTNLVATKSPSGKVYIYDISKESGSGHVSVCEGHKEEGYGLEWSRLGDKDEVISAGNDGLICLWKVSGNVKTVQPLGVFQGHKGSVEDVSWNQSNPHCFVSVGEDKTIQLWDTRERVRSNIIEDAHYRPINAVECHPTIPSLLLTGSSDGTYRLWDTRVLGAARRQWIHSMPRIHYTDILSLQWNPSYAPGFVSTSGDRRVLVHDLSRIGDEQEREDVADGPPEMLFMHSGHTGRVEDCSLREGDGWLCASVSDDNVVQVWSMSRKIYGQDDQANERYEQDKILEEYMDATKSKSDSK